MDNENKELMRVGETASDGTIYLGISPDTCRPIYAAPADAPSGLNFNEAAGYAKNLEVGDKKDFRVPTQSELRLLFAAREKELIKKTLHLVDEAYADASSCYWSSTPSSVGGNKMLVRAFNFCTGVEFGDGDAGEESYQPITAARFRARYVRG